ncbi:MAG: hypothetical protein ACP5NF_00935 [Thermoanaerobaculum sp.]
MRFKSSMKKLVILAAVALTLVVLGSPVLEAGICYNCGFDYRLVCVRVGRELVCERTYGEFCAGSQPSGFRLCSAQGCICFLEEPGCQVFLI